MDSLGTSFPWLVDAAFAVAAVFAVSHRIQDRALSENVLELRQAEIMSNNDLIQHLQKKGFIRSHRVAQAMLRVDRKFFAGENPHAYFDEALPIGHNATISAPHMHAVGLDILDDVIPQNGARVLDIGVGSGYVSACLSELVGSTGKVFGVEHVTELVQLAESNLRNCDASRFQNVSIKLGDGFQGWEENGPYDAIYVGAAAEVLPETLVRQLKPGGRMIIPVGPRTGFHQLMRVDVAADGKNAQAKSLGVVRFTPLQRVDEQLAGEHRGGRTRVVVTDDDTNKRALVLPHVVPAPDATPQEIALLRGVSEAPSS